MNLAIDVRARLAIINPIAVADVEARLGAVPPDRVLNEPRKRLGKPGIELPGIDPLGHGLYNVGAAASLVAGRTIGMVGLESCRMPVRTRKLCTKVSMAIMLAPTSRQRCRRLGAASRMQTRSWSGPCPRRHRPPSAVRSGLPAVGRADWGWRVIGTLELPVDPADQVAVGNVANKQE